MERAAIDELAPPPDGCVLAVGFGPGVGIAELVPRLPHGFVGGVDPSAAMVHQAGRRNRAAVDAGRVHLSRSTADSIPWPDETFVGVLAVNSMQLWDPLDASVREVGRVLAPGGVLVTVTHVWAIEKRSPLERFVGSSASFFTGAGLDSVDHRTVSFRAGAGLVLRAKKHSPVTAT